MSLTLEALRLNCGHLAISPGKPFNLLRDEVGMIRRRWVFFCSNSCVRENVMQQGETPVAAECCGIHCTQQKLTEIDSGRIMVTIPKQDIKQITLRYGIQAPNPTAQIVFGFILIGLGYFPALHLIHWIQHGGVLLAFECWIIPLVVVGVWLVVGAFKRGYFLEVEQPQGRKRLAFRTKPDRKELDSFLGAVELCFQFKIFREVLQ